MELSYRWTMMALLACCKYLLVTRGGWEWWQMPAAVHTADAWAVFSLGKLCGKGRPFHAQYLCVHTCFPMAGAPQDTPKYAMCAELGIHTLTREVEKVEGGGGESVATEIVPHVWTSTTSAWGAHLTPHTFPPQ
eukprot:358478-Chlamydomonas_euryale.AAC.27